MVTSMRTPDELPMGDERRSSARYGVEGVKVYIGWHHPQGFESIPAEIRNISLGGVAVSGVELPSGVCSLWIRLADNNADHVEWVSAKVVEARVDSEGKRRIRMRFAGACPYEFFKAIVFPRGNLDETPSAHGPSGSLPPSDVVASPGPACVTASLPETPAVRHQPKPHCMASNAPAGTNHLRAAFAARQRVRADNLRGSSGNPGR
jgi:hypothetical protein